MTPHAIRPFLRSFSRRNITTSLIPRIAPCLANNHCPIARFLTVFFLFSLIWRVASYHSAAKWLAPLFLTFSSVYIIHVILYHFFYPPLLTFFLLSQAFLFVSPFRRTWVCHLYLVAPVFLLLILTQASSYFIPLLRQEQVIRMNHHPFFL